MKALRLILIGVIALAVIIGVGLAVALNPRVQTWAVRRSLRSHPELSLTIGSVTAGWGHVVLNDVRLDREGVVLVAPEISADLGVFSAVVHRQVSISRLQATGLQLTFASTRVPATQPHNQPNAVRASATAPRSGGVPSPRFSGILTPFDLPCDLEIGQVELSGTVQVEAAKARVQFRVRGGGFGAGREGRLNVTADASLTDEPVQTAAFKGAVLARMASPRHFDRVAVVLDATATGPRLTKPVSLHVETAAEHSTRGEKYALFLDQADRPLLRLQAELPATGGEIIGNWSLDLRDDDLTPFLLGRPLPTFVAQGYGQLNADAAFSVVHSVGTIKGTADRLEVLDPKLSEIGAVRLTADIDVAKRNQEIVISKVDVALSQKAGVEIASVRALQPFIFGAQTGELRAADPSRELVLVALSGVPLNWLKPFLHDVALKGNSLRGELVATPRAGGVSFRTKSAVAVDGLAVSYGGKPLIAGCDIAFNATGDYTPGGWQIQCSGLTLRDKSGPMLLLDARAGRLAGAQQPIKATGQLSAALGGVLTQPWAGKSFAVKKGDVSVEFAASFDHDTAIQANVAVRNLATEPGNPGDSLPAIEATIRADIAPGGRMTVNAPLNLERGGRKSDMTVAGTFSLGSSTDAFDAQVSSTHLVVDDAKVLMSVVHRPVAAVVAPALETATPPPPWIGLNGKVALNLRQVVYSGSYVMKNIAGVVRFADGAMKFENVQAAVDAGQATVNGAITFDDHAAVPFTFGADVDLEDFDPGPLFRAVSPKAPPTVEGKFTVSTKLTAHGTTLHALPAAIIGEIELTSRGGTFRGLQVSVGNLVENSSKLKAWLASAGDAIASLAGRKDDDEITSRSQAANELATMLSSIAYDQLALTVTRDEALNTDVKEFSLISPDFRISGTGHARSTPGRSPLNDVVELELNIRARGRAAELMKFLGVLDSKADDLGYASCTLPVRVAGRLSRLDTTELSNRLVALAVAKTGLTEKAVDWINRLRGKSTN